MNPSRRIFFKAAGSASALLGIGGVLSGFSATNYSRNDDAVAKGLLTLTNWFGAHSIWYCNGVCSMEACFEEAYAVRGLLRAGNVLKMDRVQTVAHSVADRTVSYQGVHEKDMFDMGYGYNVNEKGVVNCSCVADAASSASMLIEVVKAYPAYPDNRKYIDAVKRYADYVLATYTTENGVIGVGILGHQINPMPEYWCANSLFAETLIGLGEVTGESKYYDAAVVPVEYVATYDYLKSTIPEWKTCPAEIILYAASGLIPALNSVEMKKRLSVTPHGVCSTKIEGEEKEVLEASNRVVMSEKKTDNTAKETIYDLVKSRWAEFSSWITKNQYLSGVLPPPAFGYHAYEAGLSWLIFEAEKGGFASEELLAAAVRQTRYFSTNEAKTRLCLYADSFASSLALLSLGETAAYLIRRDKDGFEKAIDDVQKDPLNMLW